MLQTTEVASLVTALGGVYSSVALVRPQHDAQYWDKVTAGFDFSEADRVPAGRFNRVLWKGLMGSKPYPALLSHISPQVLASEADDD